MLKPLPFAEPAGIVELYSSAKKAGLDKMPANVPIYLDYSKNASSYETIALWSFGQQMFGADDAPNRLPMASATAELFTILRVQPLLGQFFTKEQNKPGADKVIVLTQSFWQTQFAEDPATLTRTADLQLDQQSRRLEGQQARNVDLRASADSRRRPFDVRVSGQFRQFRIDRPQRETLLREVAHHGRRFMLRGEHLRQPLEELVIVAHRASPWHPVV
jgi:hypothetical protein